MAPGDERRGEMLLAVDQMRLCAGHHTDIKRLHQPPRKRGAPGRRRNKAGLDQLCCIGVNQFDKVTNAFAGGSLVQASPAMALREREVGVIKPI